MGNRNSYSVDNFIADNVSIIGDVRLGKNVNIWYGAVLRGDISYIEVGDCTNIQDNAVVHVDYDQPAIIGSNVTVGHSAIIHGARISSNVLIGMGAIILNDAEIGEGSIIGAGALVKENEKVPPFSLVVGVPGRVVKELDDSILKKIKESAEEYIKIAKKWIRGDP
ncbi:gamma carbonic anhydrase family protein [candidate division WOR-3 bacterium]|nr:gamma carbonic anhydrase family protein [candidate division WOR-3 bacterium]MCK4528722.1 gamma carbonic anhydrase family protein [candidate division WOR-3 bacterium]